MAVAALVALALLVVCLFSVAVRLEVDYFDAYESFIDGQAIVAHGGLYSVHRAPLFPLLFSLLLLAERAVPLDLLAFRASHLLAVGFFVLLLVTYYRLLRLQFAPLLSLAGTTALGFSSQVVHYAPTFKEDIAGTLLTTAAFLVYSQAWRTRRESNPERPAGDLRNLAKVGILMGLAGVARFNLLPLLLACVGAYELMNLKETLRGPGGRRQVLARFVALFVVPLLLGLTIAVGTYVAAGLAPLRDAPGQFVADAVQNLKDVEVQGRGQGPLLSYEFVYRALTPPLAACAALGLLVALWRRLPGVRLYFLWFVVFFAVHTYGLAHKEIRYLFPVFPPLYFFAIVGAKVAVEALARLVPLARHGVLAAAATVGLALWPLVDVARECRRFGDPVYTVNFARRVSEEAARLAAGNRIFWLGPYYPIHPRDYLFHKDDMYLSIYHFSWHIVQFYLRSNVWPVTGSGPRVDEDLLREHWAYTDLNDGDVFIVNREPDYYTSASLPPRLSPLRVARLRGARLQPAGRFREAQLFRAGSAPGDATVTVRRAAHGYAIQGAGLPPGGGGLCLEFADAPPVVWLVRPGDGSLDAGMEAPDSGLAITGVVLRWWEPGRDFALPARGSQAP